LLEIQADPEKETIPQLRDGFLGVFIFTRIEWLV
jgi:hypothetical protein